MHETKISTLITCLGTLTNVLLNRLLMPSYGAWGIAVATSLAAVVQAILLLLCCEENLVLHSIISDFSSF